MRKHSMVMAKIINARGYTKIAEVGVWKGRFLSGIMWVCPHVTEYWGIDTWDIIHNPEYAELNMAKLSKDEWTEVYLSTCNLLKFHPQLKLIRAPSVEAAKLFPKGYFDMVFIDADHSYEPALQDLKTWTPLVREGGIMSGHDFTKRHIGVKKAVWEFFEGKSEKLEATCWMKEI